jgi:hypothetical protein
MPSVINIAILVESMGPSRLRKNYFGRLPLDGPYVWHNRRTVLQDAQKGQASHPPNPGAPRRAYSQARPQQLSLYKGWVG